jgi:hypothetical protein
MAVNPFQRALTKVQNTQGYWSYGLCPLSNILKEYKISETGSVSFLGWKVVREPTRTSF